MEASAVEFIEKYKAHLWHHLTQHKQFQQNDPMIVVEGKGVHIRDIKGNEYLDGLAGGVWCVSWLWRKAYY